MGIPKPNRPNGRAQVNQDRKKLAKFEQMSAIRTKTSTIAGKQYLNYHLNLVQRSVFKANKALRLMINLKYKADKIREQNKENGHAKIKL